MQDKTIRKTAIAALFTVCAALCGILEGILPLQFLIPVPGVKLGIANIFIIFAYLFLGSTYAFAITIAKALTVFLFTGNSISFLLSISGAIVSFVAILVMMRMYNKIFSFIGISSVSAVFHGFGQLILAYFIVGDAVLYYLPIMLCACAITGVFTGTLMNVSVNKVSKFIGKVVI